MATKPFTTDPALTQIVIAYMNSMTDYIADLVAPRLPPLSTDQFEWDQQNIQEMYTIPNTRVGRVSAPNQVTFSSTRIPDKVEDYGLDSPVPQRDIDAADDFQDPLGTAAQGVAALVMLDREKRVADKYQTLATYNSGLRVTLSGTSQFNDPNTTTGANVINYIKTRLDFPLVRPNTIIFGQEGWTQFSTLPAIVEAALGTGADKGSATTDQVARLLDVDRVIVGKSRQSNVNLGQTAALSNYVRLWGKSISMVYLNPLAQLTGPPQTNVTFAMTAQFGNPVGQQFFDPKIGLRGGYWVRAGEQVKEVYPSNLCGYYIQNAFA